jgi:hypothetical protein
MFLVHRREPLNKELHNANPSQACHHLGLLCILASPPLKQMVYHKGNRFENLVVPLGPLDIIVVVHFQHNFFFTLLSLPNSDKILGMLILANFFVQEEGLAPCIMRAPPFCLLGPHFLADLEFLIHKIHELEHFELECQSNITTFQAHGCI